MKQIFRQAAETAQQVPDNMQVAAFNRALDLLTGNPKASQENTEQRGKTHTGSRVAIAASDEPKLRSAIEALIASIDTTEHPEVASATRVLDRALMVFQIALRSHEIDGLTPPEIALLLTENTRLVFSSR